MENAYGVPNVWKTIRIIITERNISVSEVLLPSFY